MTNSNTGFAIDLRLLANRKALELQGLSKDSYTDRGTIISIERKYAVVIEALQGLYMLNIQHNCSLVELLVHYNLI